MPKNEPAGNELVEQILDHHDADSFDELPHVVQNMIDETPGATYDENHPLATSGRNG